MCPGRRLEARVAWASGECDGMPLGTRLVLPGGMGTKQSRSCKKLSIWSPHPTRHHTACLSIFVSTSILNQFFWWLRVTAGVLSHTPSSSGSNTWFAPGLNVVFNEQISETYASCSFQLKCTYINIFIYGNPMKTCMHTHMHAHTHTQSYGKW